MPARYLKKNHGTETPANYLFFDTETYPYSTKQRHGVICHKWRLGVAIVLRLEKGQVTRRQIVRLPEPESLWELMRQRMQPKIPLYCVAHNLSFDFRIAGGWRIIEDNNPRKWRIVITDPPMILRGKIDGKRVVFLDSYNWFPTSLEQMGVGVGLPKGIMPPFTASDEDWYLYCQRDCEILEGAIVGLIRWWREHDLGVLGQTTAKSSYNAYRHRWMVSPLLHHDSEESYGLERNSYYGGEVQVRHAGAWGGTIYHLDVNALYPSVMRANVYPTKLIRYYPDADLRWLRARCDTPCMVAQVWIDTTERSYPRRDDGRTRYPVGVYRTTLGGVELMRAIQDGHVVSVEGVSLYELHDCFGSWADDWWSLRLAAKRAGNVFQESLIKLLMNSLNGKFAQKSGRWEDREYVVPPAMWAEWSGYDLMEKRLLQYRSIAGCVQESVIKGEPAISMPAIASWITSYGRERMRRLREVAGEHDWLYQDTDSLLVTEVGMQRLYDAGEIQRYAMGRMKVVDIGEGAYVFAPKHYQHGKRLAWSGVPSHRDHVDRDTFGSWEWESLRQSLRRQDIETYEVRYSVKTYPHIPIDGSVDQWGWVVPLERMDLFDGRKPGAASGRPHVLNIMESIEMADERIARDRGRDGQTEPV